MQSVSHSPTSVSWASETKTSAHAQRHHVVVVDIATNDHFSIELAKPSETEHTVSDNCAHRIYIMLNSAFLLKMTPLLAFQGIDTF